MRSDADSKAQASKRAGLSLRMFRTQANQGTVGVEIRVVSSSWGRLCPCVGTGIEFLLFSGLHPNQRHYRQSPDRQPGERCGESLKGRENLQDHRSLTLDSTLTHGGHMNFLSSSFYVFPA